ncbi:MAG: hypothetical protein AABX11_07460 [Nanoarchaeota archaeon]
MEDTHDGLAIDFNKTFLEREDKSRRIWVGEILLARWILGTRFFHTTIGRLEKISKGPFPMHRTLGITGEYFYLHLTEAYQLDNEYGQLDIKYKGNEKLMADRILGVYSDTREQELVLNKIFPGKTHNNLNSAKI